MNFSEATFESWAKGPGQTETDKCTNAETAVRKAIAACSELEGYKISVFPQGSYRSRTNVRQESDVDICVRCSKVFFADYPGGKTRSDFGNGPGGITFSDFKNAVQTALKKYFGESSVTRGNKAFDIHANTYRIDADVVPTLEYRQYTGRYNADGTHHFLEGVSFLPDSGDRIINWPEQNYVQGVAKNDRCNRHYKRVVRILKRLLYQMRAEKVAGTEGIGSFLIESLVWNAPDNSFQHPTYTEDVRATLAHLWNATKTDEACAKMTEVNGCKRLFGAHQGWTVAQAHNFLLSAWNYIGFK